MERDRKEARLDDGEQVGEGEGKEKTPEPGGGGVFPLHGLCELGAGVGAGGVVARGGVELGDKEQRGSLAHNHRQCAKSSNNQN